MREQRTFIYTHVWDEYTYSHGGLPLYGRNPTEVSALWYDDFGDGAMALAAIVLNHLRQGAVASSVDDLSIESYVFSPRDLLTPDRPHTVTVAFKGWNDLTTDQIEYWLTRFASMDRRAD